MSVATLPNPVQEASALPAQVQMILSALEAGAFSGQEKRRASRRHYHVRARLRLFVDAAGAPAWVLYTRDVSARGIGFICQHRLPLGYGGTLSLCAPDGTSLTVDCVLLRCRETVHGWYEGSLYFNREQFAFKDL